MKTELLQFSEKNNVAKLFIETILKDVGIKVKRDVINNLEFSIDVFQEQVLPEYFKSIDFFDVVSSLSLNLNEVPVERIKKLDNDFTQLVSSF